MMGHSNENEGGEKKGTINTKRRENKNQKIKKKKKRESERKEEEGYGIPDDQVSLCCRGEIPVGVDNVDVPPYLITRNPIPRNLTTSSLHHHRPESQRQMEQTEPIEVHSPGASLLKTYQTCFRAKIRCRRARVSGACDRCQRLNKTCVFRPARRNYGRRQ